MRTQSWSERLFLSRFTPGDPAECWEWTGPKTPKGYGSGGQAAHRRSYEYHAGATLEPEDQVLHSCDNPPCVNPHHLRVGTNAENHAEKVAKGRQRGGGAKGSRQMFAKLDEAQVQEILAVAQLGDCHGGGNMRALADQYQVSRDTIYLIAKGRSWKHIERTTTQ